MSVQDSSLKINEIFYSIQGESTHAGRPCVFIRLTYCNLRCTYCDTTYAFFEGREMTIEEIVKEVKSYQCPLVEITGGEPLIQKNAGRLMQNLADQGFEILLETAGHMDISTVDQRVKIIMDLKCPSSGESSKILWRNLDHLKPLDEIKFVISDRTDFDWAVETLNNYDLHKKWIILFSPVEEKLEKQQLAEWILQCRLPVRMQVQMHKIIWGADKRGV